MTSEILGVAIGVVFMFMLFSVFLSATLEAISSAMKLRGRALRVALERLLDDPDSPVQRTGFGLIDAALDRWHRRASPRPAASAEPIAFNALFNHPLVAGAGGKGLPSYVPDTNFTTALLHTLMNGTPQASVAAVTERVAQLPPGPVRTALESALLDAQGDWAAMRAGIDRWYTNAMDRLSGEYKRFSQLITFLLGLVLAASFNLDAVGLAQQLYADPAMRAKLAEQAGQYVQLNPNGPPTTKANDPLNATSAPQPAVSSPQPPASAPQLAASTPDPTVALQGAIDQWIKQRDLLARTVPGATTKAEWPTVKSIQHSGLGWLVTALAGMLGAPFWFDLLTKLTNLRGTGPKPQNTDNAASGVTP